MTAAEFVYSVLLRPRLLRVLANRALRTIIPKSVKRYGTTIVLNPDDPVVSGAITFRVYEKPETRFFLSVCRPGMTYLDIGANIGYYTALAALRVGPGGRVIALEPDPECYEFLTRTIAANSLSNVTPLRKAASNSIGLTTLYRNLANRGDNRLYANELSTGKTTVETVTVDKLLDGLSVKAVDLIKMDIQGYEGHALLGMEKTLSQEKPLIMLSEFWPKGLSDAKTDAMQVLNNLVARRFQLYEVTQEGRLRSLVDFAKLINRYPGRRYTNIVATRGIDASPLLKRV